MDGGIRQIAEFFNKKSKEQKDGRLGNPPFRGVQRTQKKIGPIRNKKTISTNRKRPITSRVELPVSTRSVPVSNRHAWLISVFYGMSRR